MGKIIFAIVCLMISYILFNCAYEAHKKYFPNLTVWEYLFQKDKSPIQTDMV